MRMAGKHAVRNLEISARSIGAIFGSAKPREGGRFDTVKGAARGGPVQQAAGGSMSWGHPPQAAHRPPFGFPALCGAPWTGKRLQTFPRLATPRAGAARHFSLFSSPSPEVGDAGGAPDGTPSAAAIVSEGAEAVAGGAVHIAGGAEEFVRETALESTLWSRFYGGDPEFWVNVAYAQDLLSHVHDVTGLPWWGSIVCVTVCTRVLLFPVFVYQQQVASRLQQAVPALQAAEHEYAVASQVYNDPAALKRRNDTVAKIYAEGACHPWRLGVNMLAIGPAFMSFFFGIKSLGALDPTFALGGALWFVDLSAVDPYHALPVAACGTFLAVMETALAGRRASMPPMQYQMQRGVQRILCLSLAPLLVGMKYPAGVYVYWITNNAMSFLQVLLFNQPRVRAVFGLPPIPTSVPTGAQQQFERQFQSPILKMANAEALTPGADKKGGGGGGEAPGGAPGGGGAGDKH